MAQLHSAVWQLLTFNVSCMYSTTSLSQQRRISCIKCNTITLCNLLQPQLYMHWQNLSALRPCCLFNGCFITGMPHFIWQCLNTCILEWVMYVCRIFVRWESYQYTYRALQAVWGIEEHSNLDPVVTDPAQHQCAKNVCVNADISFLAAVCLINESPSSPPSFPQSTCRATCKQGETQIWAGVSLHLCDRVTDVMVTAVTPFAFPACITCHPASINYDK